MLALLGLVLQLGKAVSAGEEGHAAALYVAGIVQRCLKDRRPPTAREVEACRRRTANLEDERASLAPKDSPNAEGD